MYIIKDKQGKVVGHFTDKVIDQGLLEALNNGLGMPVISEKLPLKHYMSVEDMRRYRTTSVDYITESMRIIEDFVYDSDLKKQVYDLILAVRAKAVSETADKLTIKADHLKNEVNHYL